MVIPLRNGRAAEALTLLDQVNGEVPLELVQVKTLVVYLVPSHSWQASCWVFPRYDPLGVSVVRSMNDWLGEPHGSSTWTRMWRPRLVGTVSVPVAG